MDPAQKKIIQNHVDHAKSEATKAENDRCMTILEMAIKSPHAASDEFLGRMSFALDLMQDTACHWSEAKKRFSKMEDGASPEAAAEPISRAEELINRTLAAKRGPAAATGDLQEQALELLNQERPNVRP